jgi:hypothetical protein
VVSDHIEIGATAEKRLGRGLRVPVSGCLERRPTPVCCKFYVCISSQKALLDRTAIPQYGMCEKGLGPADGIVIIDLQSHLRDEVGIEAGVSPLIV